MKKSTKIALSLVASMMLFTGCGGGGSDDSSDNNLNSGSQKQSYINGSTTTAKHAKAQLGVLSDATVKIYGLGNKTKKLLFTETTTSGSTIEQIGNFNAHENELLNDVYYLYEVSGGNDYDSDDDGIVNQTPLKNDGTFRAVIKGSTVKSLGGKITISAVSEIIYTKIKKSISTPKLLDGKMDEISRIVIKDDLNNDGKIDNSDIVQYNPINDEDSLHDIYKGKIRNIVDDIHKNKYINLVVKPIIRGGTFTINQQISQGKVIGKIDVVDDGNGDLSFSFIGRGWNAFSINQNGDIYIAHAEELEIKIFKLKVRASNKAGKSNIVDIVVNVTNSLDNTSPVITADSYYESLEIDGLSFAFKIKDDTKVTATLEGEDKDSVHLFDSYDSDMDEHTYYINADSDFENPQDADKDHIYHVAIVAKDMSGNESRKNVTLKTINADDEQPILDTTYVTFKKEDDIKSKLKNGEIYLGKMKVYSGGDTPIHAIELYNISNTDHYNSKANLIRVENDGSVYLKNDTSYLDNFDEEDGTRDKAIKYRDEFLKNFETEGAINSFSIAAKNSSKIGDNGSQYRYNVNTSEFKIVTTTNEDYAIHPEVLSSYRLGYASFLPSLNMFYSDEIDSKILSKHVHGKGFVDVKDPNHFERAKSNIKDYDIKTPVLASSNKSVMYASSNIEVDKDTTKYAIKILDIHDLKNIKYLSRIVSDKKITNFVLTPDEKYIYMINDSNFLKIYDVSNPSNPSLVYTSEKGYYKYIKFSKDGDRCYLYTSASIKVFDTTTPDKPKLLNTILKSENTSFSRIDVFPEKDIFCYLQDGSSYKKIYQKLKICKINSDGSYSEVGYFELNKYRSDIDIMDDSKKYSNRFSNIKISPEGTRVYVLGYGNAGLSIVDIKEPSIPKLSGYIGGLYIDSRKHNIAISNDGNSIYGYEGRDVYAIDVREDSEK